jgi:peptidyl-prolyl cis-trans isomerase A (cyclophilin A)
MAGNFTKEIHAVKLLHRRSGLLVAVLSLVFFATNAFAQAPASGQAAPAKKPASSGSKGTTHAGFDQALLHPANLKAQAPENFQVKFETTAGDFTVTVTRSWAPLGADRFYNLCKHHFYDNAAFFRVVPGFVVQFGLGAHPAVNEVWDKARFQDDPVKETNRPGTLTFATAGPNTRTTQLFINLGNNAALDRQGFSAFGEVTDGFDVVKKINAQYGEQPDQDKIRLEGAAYIDKNFPKIDKIKTTTIIGEPAAAPAKKPAAKAAPKPQS